MAKKRALGRGLSALLSADHNEINSAQDKNADQVVGNIMEISLSDIEVNPFQPRTQFDSTALEELAGSIKELGVIQPITVRKNGSIFQLVSGERRFRASKLAGLETIPAYVRLANDQEMLEMALVENIQRQDLDAIEVALSYQRMIDEINLTQDEMSKRVGKKRSTITNYLRLLKLDPIVQTGIRDKMISMGHGRALIIIEDPTDQIDVYEQIIKNNLSVRQTEDLVKRFKEQDDIESSKPKKSGLTNSHKKAIKDFSNHFNTKIAINRNTSGKGKITIEFKNDEDFERIKNLIKP
ncbi:putative chromosome-partitioning protein ParB [Flavobacteriaceae bacterium UJ101]|nr:putative chromosome-partitioning protein ParB [Flavobacteriaceae bacterium UJ101]